MSDQDTNLQTVARKLDDLTAKMNEALRASRRRNATGLTFSVVLILLIAAYLGYAYSRYANEVNPQVAAAVTQEMLNNYLPEASEQLEMRLKDSAPSVIDSVEKRVRALPDDFALRLSSETKRHVDENMPKLEEEMYLSLKTGLARAKDEVAKSAGKNDEERFRDLLKSLAGVYGTESIKAISEFHAKYAHGAKDLIAHLDTLAENKMLDKDQQLQREIVQRFLVLSTHYEAASGKVNLTSFEKPAPIPGTK